jgi:hypothetical protein
LLTSILIRNSSSPTPSVQIISYFDFSTFINFAMHIDIYYCLDA